MSLWTERFVDSVKTYHQLKDNGFDKKDLIYMIPRTLKLYTVMTMDGYNLLSGYTPLRMCTTCEEEMRSTTMNEVDLIKDKFDGSIISQIIMPKCGYVGVCPDRRSRPCGEVNRVSPLYDEEIHKKLIEQRNELIETSYNPSKK